MHIYIYIYSLIFSCQYIQGLRGFLNLWRPKHGLSPNHFSLVILLNSRLCYSTCRSAGTSIFPVVLAKKVLCPSQQDTRTLISERGVSPSSLKRGHVWTCMIKIILKPASYVSSWYAIESDRQFYWLASLLYYLLL